MERRIAPPKEFEELLDKLTEAHQDRPAVFSSKQKVLMFAAAFGHSLGARVPIDKKGTAIRMDIFQNALDDGFVNALAVKEVQNLSVLSADKEDERATIFEEYVNRGLREIQTRCYEAAGDPLQILVEITESARRPVSGELVGIDASLLKDLLG